MHEIKDAFKIGNRTIERIRIRNKGNMEVSLLSYGAAIVEMLVPDREGNLEDIVLTYENLKDYITNPPYFGATVGRTAGRIAQGQFYLDDKYYPLAKNYGLHQGHGGAKGFSYRIWDYEIREATDRTMVVFTYQSEDREEGYPGNLKAQVIYTLTDENQFMIEYEAEADQKTLCNLTNHAYFNLSGNYKRKVTEQYLKIKSDYFLALDSTLVPTGELITVAGTSMDFNQSKLIGAQIESNYEQLLLANGYDHPWLLREEKPQIEMMDPISGRKMEITTTYPCVVIYSYNFPQEERLKHGKIGSKYDGICFETQYEPDGIHHDHFHSAILEAGEKYYHKTIFQFSIIR